MIKNCLKGFRDQGVGKVISPRQTCERVLEKLQTTFPSIYKHSIFIERPTHIPQYRVIGTEHYQQIVGRDGTNGKGHTKEQALASGLMEMVERYSCYKYLQDCHRVSSWQDMQDNPFEIEDFGAQFLDGGIGIEPRKLRVAKVRWSEGMSLDGQKVYLPMNLINFALQGSNGMAAGNSLEEALLHAVCEVIERHCLTIIQYNKVKTPLIRQDTIRSPMARELIKRFKSVGLSLLIKDFSLGLGLPVIGVITRFGKNECNLVAGVATHREEALTRALTEVSQGLGIGGCAFRASGQQHCFDRSDTISFEAIPCIDNNNIRLEIEAVEKLLHRQNMKTFFVDTTDGNLSIPAVYVYIAGAKYYDAPILYRNSMIMLVNESLGIGKRRESRNYILGGIDSKDGNQGIYFYYMADLLLAQSRYREAISYFSKALDANGSNKEIRENALLRLGLCYEWMGDINSAINIYTKLLDLSVGESWTILEKRSRVLSLFPGCRFFKAKSLYEEIKIARRRSSEMRQQVFIKKFSAYQESRRKITQFLTKTVRCFGRRRYEDCLRMARKAISSHSFVGKIYELNLLSAYCHFELDRYKEAINQMRRAEKIDPDNGKINLTLSRYYQHIGGNKRCQEELDKGLRKVSTLLRMKIDLFDKPVGREGWMRKHIVR